VARDYALAYPIDGRAVGIGPIEGIVLPVCELDSDHDTYVLTPDGRMVLHCTSSEIEVIDSANDPPDRLAQ
jgi:hypothetical protein